MALVDLAIVVVILLSIVGGLTQGFFRSAFTLGGLVLGVALAAWNYSRVAELILPLVHLERLANALGFLLIALIVMVLAVAIGKLFSNIFHHLGLGCLDRLAGAVFGVFQGALLVTLVILAALAFFPNAQWLREAKLPKYFFGACHLSSEMSPSDLARRVQKGLNAMEDKSPEWLHPDNGKL